jgi:hypothetical protein
MTGVTKSLHHRGTEITEIIFFKKFRTLVFRTKQKCSVTSVPLW